MFLFYTEDCDDTTAVLIGDESKHCSRVLRKRVGDKIELTDGRGRIMSGIIESITKEDVKLHIAESTQQTKPEKRLHMLIVPTKNMSRMEWLVEKSVELGVESITFTFTKNSERRKIRLDRVHKIALSAMKQSRRYFLPKLSLQAEFKQLISNLESDSIRYIGHYIPSNPHIYNCNWSNDNYFLIGPEGDFTKEELEYSTENGFIPLNLSHSRLRTETAALAVCCAFNVINGY